MSGRILSYTLLNAFATTVLILFTAGSKVSNDLLLGLLIVFPFWLLLSWTWIFIVLQLRPARLWAYAVPVFVMGLYLWFQGPVMARDQGVATGFFVAHYFYSIAVLEYMHYNKRSSQNPDLEN